VTERLLGIVGGVGPEATADYYRRMIDRWRVRGRASTYPSFIIDSLNSRKALDSILAGDLDPIARLYEESVARLAAAGAGLVIIASVMTHIVYDRVQPRATVPMLSIIDALVAAAQSGGIRRPLLLGTRPTTEGEFFARPFEAAGIDIVRPDEPDLAWVNEIYFRELVRGDIKDATRALLIDLIEKMKIVRDIDGVILGGTELPLILREPTYSGVPVLDSTGVHVEAAIDWLLEGMA
jgi:aspartate racemase